MQITKRTISASVILLTLSASAGADIWTVTDCTNLPENTDLSTVINKISASYAATNNEMTITMTLCGTVDTTTPHPPKYRVRFNYLEPLEPTTPTSSCTTYSDAGMMLKGSKKTGLGTPDSIDVVQGSNTPPTSPGIITYHVPLTQLDPDLQITNGDPFYFWADIQDKGILQDAPARSSTCDEPQDINEVYSFNYADHLIVFVSHTPLEGNFASDNTTCPTHDAIACADQTCNNDAQSSNLSGTFKAWISTQANEPLDWIGTARQGTPLVDVNELEIAPDYSTFINHQDTLTSSIRYQPDGSDANGQLIWTGTHADGTYVDNQPGFGTATCADWTGTGNPVGAVGVSGTQLSNSHWTYNQSIDCVPLPSAHYIYCFQTQ